MLFPAAPETPLQARHPKLPGIQYSRAQIMPDQNAQLRDLFPLRCLEANSLENERMPPTEPMVGVDVFPTKK